MQNSLNWRFGWLITRKMLVKAWTNWIGVC